EEKKKEALELFQSNIEKRKALLKDKITDEEAKIQEEMKEKSAEVKGKSVGKEQQQLISEELELTKRQRFARLSEGADSEAKKLDEIADTLLRLIKSLKVSSVLSEDE